MTDVEPAVTDFEASGRTGRRNAVPDVQGSTAGAKLPEPPTESSASDGQEGEGSSTASASKSHPEGEEKTEGT
ncbi:cAMP-dependent protein kinase inhibitor alpha-like [Megalops cyprinoides]|uniref:cAMP-dependent protein kinase inhibitor alpha-like n=1 Tax=Megalops cyprinoides TaxID=118141 RepID=UPI0018640744|nr:cAMP-dependent protein kinase inhibitor alpha-like [Megalops cyprinoides]